MSEATVAALLEALKKLSLQAPTILVTPSFDWSLKDQYADFQLFVKSVDSWFTLQGIPEKAGELENPVHLDYILNFLGNQGRHGDTTIGSLLVQVLRCRRRVLVHSWITCSQWWTMTFQLTAESTSLKRPVSYPVRHPTSWLIIYWTLADCCNFPMDDEKEWNVQYQLVHALDNRELVKKLLTLPIKETTAKMLEVCRTHNAINSKMEALGLGSSKTVHAIHKGPQQKGQCKGHKPQQQQQRQQHSCRNCTKQHAPGWASCPTKDSQSQACGKMGHWKAKCKMTKRKQAAAGQCMP